LIFKDRQGEKGVHGIRKGRNSHHLMAKRGHMYTCRKGAGVRGGGLETILHISPGRGGTPVEL